MTKLSVSSEVLKEQVAKVKTAIGELYPAVLEQVSVSAKDVDTSKLTPITKRSATEANRYEIQLDKETTVRVGFFRGVATDLGLYDVAFCTNLREFTMNEGTSSKKTFEKGKFFTFKLIEPA